ncbi:hypothetical protein ID866_12360 [Astraeus odoratus]|nr:hypothetical protein ID866_12360 [Astraeus odoratus]
MHKTAINHAQPVVAKNRRVQNLYQTPRPDCHPQR